MQRLARLGAHLSPPLRQTWAASPPTSSRSAAASSSSSTAAAVGCGVRPTTDTATALQNFEEEGFCILKGVLTADEVTMYRDHLHGVMGDLNFLDEEGRRRDPATATFTEPSVTPPRSERSYTLISDEVAGAHFNAGQGQHWHNGDF
eukprot:COSAG06_NODE_31869_length_514_cov_1.493976_1_plen_146_part_10